MYVAEDGTRVPPPPEPYGPRRLARYRRDQLSELRGEPPLHAQGTPVVPVQEPAPDVLEIQKRFQALSDTLEEQGEFIELGERAEFDAFIANDASAVKFQEEDVLNAVQRHILGESGTVADTPALSINPAHLSGFSSTDVKRDYDEHVLGPVTMGVPVVLGPASTEASDNVLSGELPVQEAESTSSSTQSTSHATAGEAAAVAPQPSPTTEATRPGPAPTNQNSGPDPETANAKPVRAVDAHGLDLSGMDRKAPKSGGRIALITLLLLLLVAAIVLGIIFLL